MNADRLLSLATLVKIECDAAPRGPVRDALGGAAMKLAKAMQMLDEIAAGACPGCGRKGSAGPECTDERGCGRRPRDPGFQELLERTTVSPTPADQPPAPTPARRTKSALRAA